MYKILKAEHHNNIVFLFHNIYMICDLLRFHLQHTNSKIWFYSTGAWTIMVLPEQIQKKWQWLYGWLLNVFGNIGRNTILTNTIVQANFVFLKSLDDSFFVYGDVTKYFCL